MRFLASRFPGRYNKLMREGAEGERMRLTAGEIGTAVFLVLASAFVWWGGRRIADGGTLPILFVLGLLAAATAFALLVVVEGTHALVRRIAIALAFGSALPIAFLSAPLLGFVLVVFATLFCEFGSVRTSRFRAAFQEAPVGLVTRRSLSFYFSAVSLLLTAILIFTPLTMPTFGNLVPERYVRKALIWFNPLVEASVGISLTKPLDQVIADSTGVADQAVIDELRGQYAERLGLPLSGDADVAGILTQLLERQVAKFAETIGSTARIGFFATAFLIFRLLSVPFALLTLPVTLFILWGMKAGGLIARVEEPAVQSTLKWE